MRRYWFANDDIPMNILSRLPSKTLNSLKYVSRGWQNLISDRSFIKSQSKNTEPVSGFFFQEIFQWADADNKSISYIPVDTENSNIWRSVLNFLPEKVVILSSNNGLLCCRSCLPTSQPMIYVCNPLNKQWTSLQWPILGRNSIIALAFDPIHDPIDVSTDFKLVAVSKMKVKEKVEEEEEEEEQSFFFDIYLSKTGSWIRSKEFCLCYHKITKNKGILVQGILYWLTDGNQILMFDPENELSCLVMAPLPGTHFSSIPDLCIGESLGKLCYVVISEYGLQLWVLEDYFASEWELKISLSLQDWEKENSSVLYNIWEKMAGRVYGHMLPWVDPLAFKDGTLLLRVSVNVYSYQLDTRMMKKLCEVADLGPKSMFSPIVVPYSMSLVPLGET
ncbi:hypothetical protein CDL12_09826 [Handroanthus impetiginosus]|uniref:Uncharacterized protein n=1 Tax=Handroanthus impetiginosus TaxID=429701 RepID=A0A2G9HJ30_9LAMI|nr:hypothetical protein CDL12_09826 [Handroanthus impetiginosus]